MKLLAIFVLAGACNTGKPEPGKTDSATPGTNLQDSIHTKLNTSFTIELSTNMGTGFSWSLADSSYSEFLTLDSTIVVNDPEGKDNAPDQQVFYFTAIRKGETKLHFIHSRPWKKKDPPDMERIFNVFIGQ